jgi:hypothetical protein
MRDGKVGELCNLAVGSSTAVTTLARTCLQTGSACPGVATFARTFLAWDAGAWRSRRGETVFQRLLTWRLFVPLWLCATYLLRLPGTKDSRTKAQRHKGSAPGSLPSRPVLANVVKAPRRCFAGPPDSSLAPSEAATLRRRSHPRKDVLANVATSRFHPHFPTLIFTATTASRIPRRVLGRKIPVALLTRTLDKDLSRR